MRGTSFIFIVLLCTTALFSAGVDRKGLTNQEDDKPIVFEPSRSTVVIDSTLTDGNFKEGFGIILSASGLVLTNADNVYDKEEEAYADTIVLKVQDTDYNPISCFSKMKVAVVDSDRNLAILAVDQYSNVYCDPIPETSYYHMSFLKNHTIDVLSINDKRLGIEYPRLGKDVFVSYLSSRERILLEPSIAVEFGYTQEDDLRYFTSFTIDKLNSDVKNGSAVYDEAGRFLGLLSVRRDNSGTVSNAAYKKVYYPKVISTGMITGFLCNSAQKGFVDLEVKYKKEMINIIDHPMCKIILKQEKIFSQKDWDL